MKCNGDMNNCREEKMGCEGCAYDKDKCYADMGDKCYALTDKLCEDCEFYCASKDMKARYKKYRNKALASGISYNIDKYFMEL